VQCPCRVEINRKTVDRILIFIGTYIHSYINTYIGTYIHAYIRIKLNSDVGAFSSKILIQGFEHGKLEGLGILASDGSRPKRRATNTGVDVKITIFCDFRQLCPKKWRFSQETML
jgi:hypothetical protein